MVPSDIGSTEFKHFLIYEFLETNSSTFFFADFLLHPFRKPKRVRTAFSPTQLLKLEHAFESNQYVVGAERKTLAQQLSLTETQVIINLLIDCARFSHRRTHYRLWN